MARAARPLTAAAIGVLAIAACSSSSSSPRSSSKPAPCVGLSLSQVVAVTKAAPTAATALAAAPGSGVACGTVFVDGAGQLVVEVRELPGATALADFRSATASGVPAAEIRDEPSLGAGAFAAPGAVGFPLHGNAVALRAGFDGSGRQQLTSAQLVKLAAFIEQHGER
jgi:hypothetical protein